MTQGGVIGKPNVTTQKRASGLWTVGEVSRARASNTWPFNVETLNIGDAAFGGFFAGIIDTDKHASDIDPSDTRQNGQRYALFVSPQAIGEPSSGTQWRTSTSGLAESRTRWDGLFVTDHVINNETLSDFPIFEFCANVRTSNPVPSDGGSDWYIPALDELELLYRHFKPTSDNNTTGGVSDTFPASTFQGGVNLSSDPQGVAYTSTEPTQTTVTAFQAGNAEAMDYDSDARYWSATESRNASSWLIDFKGSNAGRITFNGKNTFIQRVRLVRRVPF